MDDGDDGDYCAGAAAAADAVNETRGVDCELESMPLNSTPSSPAADYGNC